MSAAIYARKSTDQTDVADGQKSVRRQIEHACQFAMRCGGFLLAGACLAACGTSPAGPCVLHARAAVVPSDAPLGRELGSNTDLLIVRNDDSSDWENVAVTVYGRFISPAKENQPTGPYAYQLDRIESNKFRAVSLRDFQKPDGGRWVSMTMAVGDVEIKAKVGGLACKSQDVALVKDGR